MEKTKDQMVAPADPPKVEGKEGGCKTDASGKMNPTAPCWFPPKEGSNNTQPSDQATKPGKDHDGVNSTQPESKEGGGAQGESGVNASRPKKNGGGWKKQGRDGWKEPYQREGMDGHAGGFKRQPRGGFRGRFREGPNRPFSSNGGGGGGYGNRNYRQDSGYQHRREMAKAEELQKASQTQKDDKIVSFDCRVRPKDELTGWIRNHKPSEMKKSDKIGYLMVLSKRLTSGTEKMFVHVAEEVENNHASLIADWEQLTQDPSAKITYPTIQQLGKKHGVRGGKWLFTATRGREDVDSLWMFLASAVASGALPCLAVKMTPVNDVDKTRDRDSREHMISVHTEDFTDEENVFEVEKMLRQIPVKRSLTYKPDMFSVIGIYRNNKYNLKPVIYSSEWHSQSGTSVIDSVLDMEWFYQGGAGDLREAKREERRKAKEEDKEELDIQNAIDKMLASIWKEPEDAAVDENQNVEGIVDLMATANIGKEDTGELEKEVKKEDCPLEVRPLEATREEKEDLESLDINAAIDKVLARMEATLARNTIGDHHGIQAADDEMDETNIKGIEIEDKKPGMKGDDLEPESNEKTLGKPFKTLDDMEKLIFNTIEESLANEVTTEEIADQVVLTDPTILETPQEDE